MTIRTSKARVGALNHIGLAVVSIEESLKQFQDLFDSPTAEILVDEGRGLRGCFIEQGETSIELLQPLRDDTVIARFLAKHGEGIHHMAFTVDDLTAKVEELISAGIPIIDGPKRGFHGPVAFTDPKATHRVLIELVQPDVH
jgi:methylmalonyl-CoA epimerase